MSQVVKETDYQDFFNFVNAKAKENASMTIAEVLHQFQIEKEVVITEYDLLMYGLEKSGNLDRSIEANAQQGSFGTSFK